MSTKEELINVIRGWVKTDNEIKQLQNTLKNKKNEKKEITEQLLEIMKTNEIDCFDINNGKIMYSKNNVKKPITKKHLLNCLSNYFDDVSGINSDNVVQFILDNREIVIKDNIRLKNK